MENISRSVGEQFIFDMCQKNPKCKSFMETMKWMVTFAYILDGLNTSTKIENCLYTCYSIIDGLKETRIKKGFMSNKDIATVACNIYSLVKKEDFIDVIDKVDNNCLLYTSPSPRDGLLSRMPSSA